MIRNCKFLLLTKQKVNTYNEQLVDDYVSSQSCPTEIYDVTQNTKIVSVTSCTMSQAKLSYSNTVGRLLEYIIGYFI